MKLTSREKKLLIVLGVAVFSWAYFNFILSPQLDKMAGLKLENKNYQEELEKIETVVTSEADVSKRLLAMNAELEKQEEGFFYNLNQGQIILLLDEIVEQTDIAIPQISFSPMTQEVIEDVTVQTIELRVFYEGNYDMLLSFLRSIRQQNKKITITNFNIMRQEEDQLNGDLHLKFYGLASSDEKGKALVEYNDDLKENPFVAIDGFNTAEEALTSDDWESPNYNDSGGNSGYISAPVEYEDSNKAHTLYRFGQLKTFFVGHPKEIFGTISTVKNSRSTSNSMEIKYDFFRNRDENIANIVFEEDVFINKQPETLGLWVYGFEESTHSIHLVLIDATGKEADIIMTNETDWTGWKRIESSLPIHITYPAKIQRIYVKSDQQDEKTKGQLLLDTIEATFPDVFPYNN